MGRHALALVLVTLVWGTTFPVLKLVTAQLSGVEVTALRFTLAACVLSPWAWRAQRAAWRDGALLGALVLVSYVAQAYGLQFISSNRSAFLTCLNVMMVPLFGLAWGQPLRLRVLLAALLACCGVGLMSWDGVLNWQADAATLFGAAAFALYVVLLSQRADRHSVRDLAATQMVCMALSGLLWMAVGGHGNDYLSTLLQRLHGVLLLALMYLGLVASAAMVLVQTWAQRRVPAERAALIYTLEPVFATVFAWFLLSETLSLRAALGALLVLLALLLSEWQHRSGGGLRRCWFGAGRDRAAR